MFWAQDQTYSIKLTAYVIFVGHRPRYNSRKNVIQEIPCEDDFFMPHDYPSNHYPDNGPSHCKIKKGSCTGDGMKMCSTGSTTKDATCYCDHTQNYVPRLLSTSPCFLQFENECMVTSSCNVIIEYSKFIGSNYSIILFFQSICFRKQIHANCDHQIFKRKVTLSSLYLEKYQRIVYWRQTNKKKSS